MQIRVLVEAGVCGLKTEIMLKGSMEDEYQILLSSKCPLVQSLEPKLQDMDLLMAAVFQAAETSGLHAACPVPTALIKAFEVFCGLALPADSRIIIDKKA